MNHIPVLVEKPIVVDTKEINDVILMNKKYDNYVSEAMWTLHSDIFYSLKEVISNKHLGKLKETTFSFSVYKSKLFKNNRIFDKSRGGGALLDIGIYLITIAYILFGKPLDIKIDAKMYHDVDLIDNLAFTNAKKIRELSIINFNKIIGSSFYNSLSEVENANIYIAKGNLIGDSAFMNSKKVSSIKLDSIKEISTNAFTNSARDSLSIDINISNVDLISSYSFSNIYPKLSLTLKNVKEITGGTFANCYNLFEVTIPNTVFNISSNIFEECYNLKNIYIEPDNMEIFNILKDNYSNINVEYINKN